jgi:hypothetical protein
MSSPIPLSEQIDVLRSRADVATWALARLGHPPEWRDTNQPGNRERCREAVDGLFNLTRAELEAGLVGLGLDPDDLGHVHLEEGSRDGLYCLSRGEIREVYYQERGGRWIEAVFSDRGEARKFLLNLWLPSWLDRLCVPCRTSGGDEINRFL